MSKLISGLYAILLCISICKQATAQRASLMYVADSSYHLYEWTKEPPACESEDTTYYPETRCIWFASYSYPFIHSNDPRLAKLINKEIRSAFDYTAPGAPAMDLPTARCPEDKPGMDLMSFKVTFQNDSFLSFTIYKDYEPSGLGNGFRHDALPFTFDLEKKKRLRLGDIIAEQQDSTVHHMIINQLKASDPMLFNETGEINNPELFQPFSTQGRDFAITEQGIVIYQPLSYGGKSAFGQIVIRPDEFPTLFTDPRIKKVFVRKGR